MQNTDPIYLERYANVYTLVSSIPADNRFDLESWGHQNDESECGTSACMAGHAGLHPWFRERGFVMIPNGHHSLTIQSGFIAEEVEAFFGFDDFGNHPFNPDAEYYKDEWDDPIYNLITPAIAAAALHDYMTEHWGIEAVPTAIDNAEARYNVDFVHQYAQWNQ